MFRLRAIRRWIWDEPEATAYAVLLGTLSGTWALEKWRPSAGNIFYQFTPPHDVRVHSLQEVFRRTPESSGIEMHVVDHEKHAASVLGGIVYLPSSFSALPEEEAAVLCRLEVLNIRHGFAAHEYRGQIGSLILSGAVVLYLKWKKHRSNVFLAIAPLVGVFATQRSWNAANTRSMYEMLEAEERVALKSVLSKEITLNQSSGKWGILKSGDDMFDLARPPLTWRMSQLEKMEKS